MTITPSVRVSSRIGGKNGTGGYDSSGDFRICESTSRMASALRRLETEFGCVVCCFDSRPTVDSPTSRLTLQIRLNCRQSKHSSSQVEQQQLNGYRMFSAEDIQSMLEVASVQMKQ